MTRWTVFDHLERDLVSRIHCRPLGGSGGAVCAAHRRANGLMRSLTVPPAESLVSKLAQFYADRTLTKAPITPADQAEAYFLLVSKRLSKTTGQVITVDGGLHEAFLR
jgi:hypothetical protein